MAIGGMAFVFGTSFLVGLSGVATPGPVLAYNIRETARRGFWAAPLIATGHSLLELLLVALLVVGVLRFLEGDTAFVIISLLGAAFLVWMGWGMIRHPGRDLPVQGGGTAGFMPLRPGVLMLGGVLISISNPFWSLWWATVGLNYLKWSQELGLGLLGIGAFYVGHILADYAWYGAISLGLVSGRRILTDTFYRGLLLVCGLFLWAMAGFFLTKGIDRLF